MCKLKNKRSIYGCSIFLFFMFIAGIMLIPSRLLSQRVEQSQKLNKIKKVLTEPDKIWIEDNQTKQLILQIKDIPSESKIAKGLLLGNEYFSHAILSPKGDYVAFVVEGFHGWCGLYEFKQEKISEIAFFFNGSVNKLLFSPNGRYLAIEAVVGGGFSTVSLFDVSKFKSLDFAIPKSTTGYPADVLLQEWSDNNLKVLLKWIDEEKWESWVFTTQEDQRVFKKLN